MTENVIHPVPKEYGLLSRLYGRVFPAYFGPNRLPAVTAALTGPDDRIRWTNFWRPTDPLGWPVPAGEREIVVRDPESLHPATARCAIRRSAATAAIRCQSSTCGNGPRRWRY
ncbi:hypothetical protein [Plantactinospora sp. GCM10030261]|uniref:hypothetical protein n=1 Tax=Plantactinospora sp. GCM10030261 TaxID=3273420 RepID=UPI00361C36D4